MMRAFFFVQKPLCLAGLMALAVGVVSICCAIAQLCLITFVRSCNYLTGTQFCSRKNCVLRLLRRAQKIVQQLFFCLFADLRSRHSILNKPLCRNGKQVALKNIFLNMFVLPRLVLMCVCVFSIVVSCWAHPLREPHERAHVGRQK